MGYKFERLEVWQLAIDYTDRVYHLSAQLPRDEEYNLKSQIRRAATSITLNIAEGSTSQVSAVPLPAAAWLFGSALLGLGALRRKQKAGNSEMAAV